MYGFYVCWVEWLPIPSVVVRNDAPDGYVKGHESALVQYDGG